MAYADCHRTDPKYRGLVFPSRDRLIEFTRLSKNTIPVAKKALIDRGQLMETGERRGESGRIEVYMLGIDADADSPNEGPLDGPSSDQDGPPFDQDSPPFGSRPPKSGTHNWDTNSHMNLGKGTRPAGSKNPIIDALLEGGLQ